MSRVYVDSDSNRVTEWAYINQDGETEMVKANLDDKGLVGIYSEAFEEEFAVFTADIPKLIKVLELAYKELSND